MPVSLEPIDDFVVGMVIRCRPGEPEAPFKHNHPLCIDAVTPSNIFYEDVEEHRAGAFSRAGHTLEQFEILAQGRLTGQVMREWLQQLHDMGRPVEVADLQPDLAFYGVRAAQEVQEWWVRQLNVEPQVSLSLLGGYLCRLTDDPWTLPPSMKANFVKWFVSLEHNVQWLLLAGEPASQWRRSLLAISEVLLNRSNYDPELITAAAEALSRLEPTLPPN
jgi:hypothetical protein